MTDHKNKTYKGHSSRTQYMNMLKFFDMINLEEILKQIVLSEYDDIENLKVVESPYRNARMQQALFNFKHEVEGIKHDFELERALVRTPEKEKRLIKEGMQKEDIAVLKILSCDVKELRRPFDKYFIKWKLLKKDNKAKAMKMIQQMIDGLDFDDLDNKEVDMKFKELDEKTL